MRVEFRRDWPWFAGLLAPRQTRQTQTVGRRRVSRRRRKWRGFRLRRSRRPSGEPLVPVLMMLGNTNTAEAGREIDCWHVAVIANESHAHVVVVTQYVQREKIGAEYH